MSRSKIYRGIMFKVKYLDSGATVATKITVFDKYIHCPLTPIIHINTLRSIVINGYLPKAFELIIGGTKESEIEFIAKDHQQRNDILRLILKDLPVISMWENIINDTDEHVIEIQQVEDPEPERSDDGTDLTEEINVQKWNELQSTLQAERHDHKAENKKLRNQVSELQLQNDDILRFADETAQHLRAECDRLQEENTSLLKIKEAELNSVHSEWEQQKNIEIKALENEHQKLMEDFERKKAAIQSEREQLVSDLTKLEMERTEFKNEIEAQREELRVREAELHSVHSELDSQRSDIEVAQSRLDSQTADVQRMRIELDTERKQFDALRQELKAKEVESKAVRLELEQQIATQLDRTQTEDIRQSIESVEIPIPEQNGNIISSWTSIVKYYTAKDYGDTSDGSGHQRVISKSEDMTRTFISKLQISRYLEDPESKNVKEWTETCQHQLDLEDECESRKMLLNMVHEDIAHIAVAKQDLQSQCDEYKKENDMLWHALQDYKQEMEGALVFYPLNSGHNPEENLNLEPGTTE